jgi:ABC-type bacteriocin/lantibiotic exporter with double-glycine peptidase domain
MHRARLWAAAAVVLAAIAAGGLLLLAAHDPIAPLRLASRASLALDGAEFLGRRGVVLQETLFDCGPAALATLLLLDGRPAPPLDSLTHLTGTTGRGTTLEAIRTAALQFGLRLEAKGPAVGSAAPTPGQLPMIAWIRRSHFVVVASGADEGTVTVLDPQIGRYRLALRAFRKRWSGEALIAY